MRSWFTKSDPLVRESLALDAEIARIKMGREVERKRAEAAELREQEQYARGDTTVRGRIEARRQARQKVPDTRRREQAIGRLMSGLDRSEGLSLCSAAMAAEGRQCSARRIGESVAENIFGIFGVNGVPFNYSYLGAAFKNLYQVQGLIRELFPYKSTIIRYIQTLDFARWACRVLYAECPTAQGLIRSKAAFVVRKGNNVSIVPRDSANDAAENGAAYKDARWFVNRYCEENNLAEQERDRYRRRCMDGEAFAWTADPELPPKETARGAKLGDRRGACELAMVEPDFIRPSVKRGQSQEDPHMLALDQEDWSFGIHTPKHRYWKPTAYNVIWNDNEEEVISTDRMCHSADRERGNNKRCLPPLLLSSTDLIGMTLLRSSLADSSRYRAAVAGAIQYQEASGGEIRTDDQCYGGNLFTENNEWELNEVSVGQAGSYLLELPPGRDFVDGPIFPPGDSLELIYDWHVRAIAQQWGVPEWVVKGASAGASFADSLTAESPSVVEFETEQARECRYTRHSVLREIRYRIEVGHLPPDFLEKYDVRVESDSVITRDSKSEAETAVILVGAGLQSKSTARTKLGIDSELEKRLIEGEADEVSPDERMATSGDEPESTGGKKKKLEGGNGKD